MRIAHIVLFALSLPVLAASSEEIDSWDAAAQEVIRLDPNVFGSLPEQIREYLAEQGCTVPQTSYRDDPHNVVQADLDGSQFPDWVVLCSKQQQSALLVFWDGLASDAIQITHWTDDKLWLQKGSDAVEYGRVVNIASPAQIIRYSEAYGKELPVDLDHDGVDDGFDGKASVVYYWDDRQWHQLQGAD